MTNTMTLLNEINYYPSVAVAVRDGNRYQITSRTGGARWFDIHNSEVEAFKTAVENDANLAGGTLYSILSEMPSDAKLNIVKQQPSVSDDPARSLYKLYIEVAKASTLKSSFRA